MHANALGVQYFIVLRILSLHLKLAYKVMGFMVAHMFIHAIITWF